VNKISENRDDRKPTHIAHICKSHKSTRRPKFAKECNLANML